MSIVITKRSFWQDNQRRSLTDTIEKVATLITVIVPFLLTIYALVGAWNRHELYWWDPVLLVGFYLWISPGVTVGLHRYFVHQSFTATTAAKIWLGILAELAIEGRIVTWSANHKEHHATSDGPLDLHSPMKSLKGLFWSHLGWLFSAYKADPNRWVKRLVDDPIIQTLDRLFPVFVVISMLLPFLLGGVMGVLSGVPFMDAAWHGLIWGGLVRAFFLHHVTWSVNSICHRFGTKPFVASPKTDQSRNNIIVALLGLGEGNHGDHHSFATSALHALYLRLILPRFYWIFDLSFVYIMGLVKLKLASDPIIPTDEQLKAKLVSLRQPLQEAA